MPEKNKAYCENCIVACWKKGKGKRTGKGKRGKDRMVFVSLISGFYGPRELQGFRVLIFTGRVAPGTSLLALPSCYFLLSAVHTAVLVSRSGVLSCCPSRPENHFFQGCSTPPRRGNRFEVAFSSPSLPSTTSPPLLAVTTHHHSLLRLCGWSRYVARYVALSSRLAHL